MFTKPLLLIALCAAPLYPVAALAEDKEAHARTTSGKAWGEVRTASRKDGRLSVEVRFETDTSGYSGEVIYGHLAAAGDATAPHLEAGGSSYSLAQDGAGKPEAPEMLETTFNYDPSKNPRVGSWKAVFDAPPAEVTEAMLILPNVAPIGPFKIKDHK